MQENVSAGCTCLPSGCCDLQNWVCLDWQFRFRLRQVSNPRRCWKPRAVSWIFEIFQIISWPGILVLNFCIWSIFHPLVIFGCKVEKTEAGWKLFLQVLCDAFQKRQRKIRIHYIKNYFNLLNSYRVQGLYGNNVKQKSHWEQRFLFWYKFLFKLFGSKNKKAGKNKRISWLFSYMITARPGVLSSWHQQEKVESKC